MNFYELPNIPYLTDEEFEIIFNNFRIAVSTESDYWIDCWYMGNNDSIVTLYPKNNKPHTTHRQFKTHYYTSEITVDLIQTDSFGSTIADYIRDNGETSYLYKINAQEDKEHLDDDVTSEPRQLSKSQLKRLLDFCRTYEQIMEL